MTATGTFAQPCYKFKIGVAGGISPTVFLGISGLTAEVYCQFAPFLQSEANSISNPYIVT